MTATVRKPWYIEAQQRAVRAFSASSEPGDRGAMLRELCRLHGGYLDLTGSEFAVTDNDLVNLPRFGMKRVSVASSDALIIDDAEALPVAGLSDVLRLDLAPRQIYPSACADAGGCGV